MKKLLTTTALAVSLCAGAAFPASAETVVGTGSTCRRMAGNQPMAWTMTR